MALVEPADAHPLELVPEAGAQLREVVAKAWLIADRDLLELACLHVVRTLGVPLDPEPDVANADELGHWWRSHAFSERERAVLGYIEYYVMDASSIPPERDEAIRRQLTLRELVNLAAAINTLEAYVRACGVLGVPCDVFALRPEDEGEPPAFEDPGPEPPPDDGVNRRLFRMRLTDQRFRDPRAVYGRTAVSLSGVDATTTEACRLRNATFQGCHY